MKKTIVVAYKFLNNSCEVEVTEKSNLANFPIYKKTFNSPYLANANLISFVKLTKSEIENLIQGKINDIVIFLENSSNFIVKNKIVATNKSINENLLINHFVKDFNSNNLCLIDYSIIEKENSKKYFSLSYITLDEAKKLNAIMNSCELNIAKIYDLNYLTANYLLAKHDKKIATFVTMDNNFLTISLASKSGMLKSEKFAIGFDDLINEVASKLNVSYREAYIKTSFLQSNCISNLNNPLFAICNEFVLKIFSKFVLFASKNKTEIYFNNLFFNSLFKNFSFWINSLKNSFDIKSVNIVSDANILISNEMNGLLLKLDEYENCENKLTITTELFTIDTLVFSKNKSNLFI